MVRVDDSGDVTKCWLTRDELRRLEEAAAQADWEREIADAYRPEENLSKR